MTLNEWQTYIAGLHTAEIELGLTRVGKVAISLGITTPECPVLVIGGTNGKGTTVATLESIYRASQYRVGAFTSPFLFRCNEQVRVNGEEVSDQTLCDAYMRIEAARGDVSLTPFEFQTLAALLILQQQPLDVWLLEVGLGGRLDAVNLMNADVAVVTSIAIDHVDWLGDTRESIGHEKAGIFRSGRPAVCGDADPPQSLMRWAAETGAVLLCQGRDFYYQEQQTEWSWFSPGESAALHHLPLTGFATQNLSSALMAIFQLRDRLPVTVDAIRQGLSSISLRGRFEIHTGDVTEIFDIAHNPAAVEQMVLKLKRLPVTGKTLAVFSMLGDKDMVTCLRAASDEIDAWYTAPLTVKRAATVAQLTRAFATAKIQSVTWADTIGQACEKARADAKPGDRIMVFGSFHTVHAGIRDKAPPGF